MEGVDTTQVWMMGVVSAMVVFGIAAIIGYIRNPEESDSDDTSDSDS